MTVNELIEELKKVKETGRGEQEVFYLNNEGMEESVSEISTPYSDDVIMLM